MKFRKILSRIRNIVLQKKPVLGRVACLGQDVYNCGLNKIGLLVNQQKVRVDLFVDMIGKNSSPDINVIHPFVKRADIFELVKQQAVLPWTSVLQQSSVLLMDSYAELVDRRFQAKHFDWAFCACYGDLRHSGEFKEHFEHQGLLPLDKLQDSYRRFFEYILNMNSSILIPFIHFPATFEFRPKYKERHVAIREAMQVMTLCFSDNIVNIEIKDEYVKRTELYRGLMPEHNPYHFHESTAQHAWQRMNEILAIT